MRLARNGMIVSATKSEAVIVATTASGSDRTNAPAPSGSAMIGKKASSSVAVQPMTAMLISCTPAIAASRGCMPSRKWRAMFSVTTMLSSTSKPKANTKPAIESWFSE